MKNNLLPHFMMIQSGVRVKDTPKIQVDGPIIDDRYIYFPETKFHIPISLWVIFSYFPSTTPTPQTLKDNKEIYLLTPNTWDPHNNAYTNNKENMLDWQGNMVERRYRKQVILSDIEEDATMAASVQIRKCRNTSK